MSTKLTPVAALVTHEVEDWEVWKSAFDRHRGARHSASILGHHVNRGADNPNRLAIYLPATSAEELQRFLASDELRAVMHRAGVKGTPDIKLMKPRLVALDIKRAAAGLIVIHRVANYTWWREGYDAFDEERRQLGITGHAVNTLMGNDNTVIVYHQASSVDRLKAFVASDELQSAMEKAGVSGPPSVSFWNAKPPVEY